MKRKIVDSASCPCCGGKDETLIHAIWECPAAQDVWGSQDSPFQKSSYVAWNFKEFFAHCLHRFNKELIDLMVVVARETWFRRNKLVFEEVFLHPDEVYKGAIKSRGDFKACIQETQPVHHSLEVAPSRRIPTIWCPPPR